MRVRVRERKELNDIDGDNSDEELSLYLSTLTRSEMSSESYRSDLGYDSSTSNSNHLLWETQEQHKDEEGRIKQQRSYTSSIDSSLSPRSSHSRVPTEENFMDRLYSKLREWGADSVFKCVEPSGISSEEESIYTLGATMTTKDEDEYATLATTFTEDNIHTATFNDDDTVRSDTDDDNESATIQSTDGSNSKSYHSQSSSFDDDSFSVCSRGRMLNSEPSINSTVESLRSIIEMQVKVMNEHPTLANTNKNASTEKEQLKKKEIINKEDSSVSDKNDGKASTSKNSSLLRDKKCDTTKQFKAKDQIPPQNRREDNYHSKNTAQLKISHFKRAFNQTKENPSNLKKIDPLPRSITGRNEIEKVESSLHENTCAINPSHKMETESLENHKIMKHTSSSGLLGIANPLERVQSHLNVEMKFTKKEEPRLHPRKIDCLGKFEKVESHTNVDLIYSAFENTNTPLRLGKVGSQLIKRPSMPSPTSVIERSDSDGKIVWDTMPIFNDRSKHEQKYQSEPQPESLSITSNAALEETTSPESIVDRMTKNLIDMLPEEEEKISAGISFPPAPLRRQKEDSTLWMKSLEVTYKGQVANHDGSVLYTDLRTNSITGQKSKKGKSLFNLFSRKQKKAVTNDTLENSTTRCEF